MHKNRMKNTVVSKWEIGNTGFFNNIFLLSE